MKKGLLNDLNLVMGRGLQEIPTSFFVTHSESKTSGGCPELWILHLAAVPGE